MLDEAGFIDKFINDYMGKVFYFCLKKTGNNSEAEDLTSDIALNIIAELKKGVMPKNINAWIWRIARNRYSVWANNRHKQIISVSGTDISDCDIEDDQVIEDEFLLNEDQKLLRRELAFISSDYRRIIVSYYIEDMSVRDIANSLNLPEGTIKSKLFRSRKILKEGMEMAREFGVMSYKPENVGFIMNGTDGKNGEPWTLLKRVMCKNIILAAYRTPSTAEELSVELGIALPYMEDELRELTNATLIKKNGSKYETNMFIVSSRAQEKIYKNLYKIAPEFAAAIIAVKEHQVKCYDDNGYEWHEGYQPYEDMKWALLMSMVDDVDLAVIGDANKSNFNKSADYLGKWGHTKRPNDGEWDLLGLEEYRGERPNFVGLHGCRHANDYQPLIYFGQYKFMYKGINNKTPIVLSYDEAKALVDISKRDFSNIPQIILDKLLDYGYIEKKENTLYPTFYVALRDKIKPLTTEQNEEHNRLFTIAKNIAMEHYKFSRDVIYEEIPSFLKDDQYQINHACANIFEMRGAVLEEALKTGYISYEENDSRKMLGAYLFI